MKLHTSLDRNIAAARSLLPIGSSFDIITRDLLLGETRAFLLGINGMCKTDVLQRIFSDLQNPMYMQDDVITTKKDADLYLTYKVKTDVAVDFGKLNLLPITRNPKTSYHPQLIPIKSFVTE